MQDVYKNIEENNEDKKRKILIAFDDMIADINNKKLYLVVTELFIRGRILIISIVSITQSCFKVPKGVRLNPTYIFIKIPNKGELQQIALNHLSDIGF